MSDITMRRTWYVLAGTWRGEHDDEIDVNGWAVVNAPRPLLGSVTWTGPFLSGIFYAAGPYDQFARSWYADDATLLVPVTPAEAVAKVRALCIDHGYDPAAVAEECPEQFRLWAEDLNLPWDGSWLSKHVAGAEQ